MVYETYAIAGEGKKAAALKAYLAEAPQAIPAPEIPIERADDNTLIIRIKESKIKQLLTGVRRFFSCTKEEFRGVVIEVKETTEGILRAVALISNLMNDINSEV